MSIEKAIHDRQPFPVDGIRRRSADASDEVSRMQGDTSHTSEPNDSDRMEIEEGKYRNIFRNEENIPEFSKLSNVNRLSEDVRKTTADKNNLHLHNTVPYDKSSIRENIKYNNMTQRTYQSQGKSESETKHNIFSNEVRSPKNPKEHTTPPYDDTARYKRTTSKKLLSVLVIVPGQGYDWGSSERYDASALAALGHLVVVTFNYRLGTLGKLLFHRSRAFYFNENNNYDCYHS